MEQDASFGRWLQQRRKALGLTQEELGQQVGIARATIRKIEADERRPSKEVAERLARCLQLAAEEEPAFIRFARGESSVHQPVVLPASVETPPWRPQARPPSNLPIAPTTFIGREHEVAAVSGLLRRADVRLLTLTGPGGIGKTRLGLQVAEALRDDYPDGIWFVALAPITDAPMITATIAYVLKVKETADQPLEQHLHAYLRDKRLLLVLDNYEQVVDAAPLISELLAVAPQLKLLVTSRVPLYVAAEQQFSVPPLPLPDIRHQHGLDMIVLNEAIQLFIQRAQAVNPAFQITSTSASVVAELCVRLDGLPLAIELAAARSKILSPEALLQRLSNRFALLTGGPRDAPARQQTLKRTMDWSYSLLDAYEQMLFARLGVFVGGCTIEAVEAVGQTTNERPTDMLNALQSLVDKSMLRQAEGPHREPRFEMLETIREYALEHLAMRRESDQIQQQHAYYFLTLVERAEPELQGPQHALWLEQLEPEHDNVRAALVWSMTEAGDVDVGLRLAGALRDFWWTRGYLSEGRLWLERLLGSTGRAETSTSVRAKALFGAGLLAAIQGDYGSATTRYEESLTISRALRDTRGIAYALNGLGSVKQQQSDYAQSTVLFEESLALFRDLDEKASIALALHDLAWLVIDQRDYDHARVLLEESRVLRREVGDKGGLASSLALLGVVARHQGNHEQAARLHAESLALRQELEDRDGIAWSLYNLGNVAWSQGDYPRAAALFDESIGLFRELEAKPGIALGLRGLGRVRHNQGDYRKAAVLFADSLAMCLELKDRQGIAECLAEVAGIAGATGQTEWAARLFGATESLFETIGSRLGPADHADYRHAVAAVRAELDPAIFVSAWEWGRIMPLEQAVAYVMHKGRAQPE